MTAFEYVLALVSVLVGLAVADLAVSLHRLLRARRRVRWDWIPLGAATSVVLVILNFWWAFYQIGQREVWTSYWSFLVLASYLICLFLLASAALPDEVPAEGIDLAEYYEENRRYFWLLFSASLLPVTAVMALGAYGYAPFARIAAAAAGNVVLLAVYLSLATVRSRRYHRVMIPLVLLLFVLQWLQVRLG